MTPVDGERRRLGKVLATVFLAALVLGPGPGSTWIDGSPEAPAFVMGVPALYAWLVFWFVVMSACVLIAAKYLWSDPE